MRMRRKKNLDSQLEKYSKQLLIGICDNLRFDAEDNGENLLNFREIFGNDNPVLLEMGCGKGAFACTLAKKNPDYNILAVEKSSNVIVEAARLAEEEQVANLRLFLVGGEYLSRFIPPCSVEEIFLNFSVPFPKKDDAIHRFTNPFFLEIFKGLLKKGGKIVQKTDDRGLFEYSLEMLSRCGFTLCNISLDLHNSPQNEENIVTEYEQKFSSLGMPIYYLEAVFN